MHFKFLVMWYHATKFVLAHRQRNLYVFAVGLEFFKCHTLSWSGIDETSQYLYINIALNITV